MVLLIKNIQLNDSTTDILIEDNKIAKIKNKISETKDISGKFETIDGTDKLALPSFHNMHTHAAMTLFRGYADDMILKEWLEQKIWPLEGKLTSEDVYWGTKLACLEMIKSGTTFFNDMYWHWNGTAKAVDEMGMRSAVSAVFIDFGDTTKAKEQIELNKKLFAQRSNYSDRIIFALGPHAIYTVSKKSLQWVKKFADNNNLLIHLHISETKKEVDDAEKLYNMRPIEYLARIGILGPNLILCHAVWLNDEEIKICAKHDVKIVYNPISNLKLSSGSNFPYTKLTGSGIKTCLGTDGCASNNNLDMFETIKFAACIQKNESCDPTVLPAKDAFNMATVNAARALGLCTGEIKEGNLADIMLIDLNRPELTPGFNPLSDIVYSANGSCVDTLICDGKFIMKNRHVDGEEEILKTAKQVAKDIINR